MSRSIAIIGGGIIGSSISLYLAKEGLASRVVVLDPDPAYGRSSTTRSASALRTQFNLGINVAMSHFSYEFYNSASAHLSTCWYRRKISDASLGSRLKASVLRQWAAVVKGG